MVDYDPGDDEFYPEELIGKVTDDEVIEEVSEIAEDENYEVLDENLRSGRGIEQETRNVFRITTGGSREAYVHVSRGESEEEYALKIGGIATVVIDEKVVKSGSSFNILYEPEDEEGEHSEDGMYIEIAEAEGGEIVLEEHVDDSLQDLRRDSRKYPGRLRCRACRRFSKVSEMVLETVVPVAVCYMGSIAIATHVGVDLDTVIELMSMGGLAVMAFFDFDDEVVGGLSDVVSGEVKLLCPRIVSGLLLDGVGYARKLSGSNRSLCKWARFC